jgi:hypothetical protein
MEAERQFLETKLERLSAKDLLSFDKYSFSSMQYQMEQKAKGAVTPEIYEFIKTKCENHNNQ